MKYILLITLSLTTITARSETVYKCTDHAGHLLYSSQVCPNQNKQVAKFWVNGEDPPKNNDELKANAEAKRNTALLVARANTSNRFTTTQDGIWMFKE